LPILNIPTRSATCLANFTADDKESKSSATIRLLRGWASKVGVIVDPGSSGSVFFGQLNQLQPNLADAGMDQADFPGDTIGYINFAPFLIGTPVIDTYKFKLAVPRIDHANDGAKRQVRVCRREGFGVEALAIGGLAAIEPGAIPAGVAYPGLDWLNRLVQMRYKGCFHRRSDEEHKEYPSESSPAH